MAGVTHTQVPSATSANANSGASAGAYRAAVLSSVCEGLGLYLLDVS